MTSQIPGQMPQPGPLEQAAPPAPDGARRCNTMCVSTLPASLRDKFRAAAIVRIATDQPGRRHKWRTLRPLH